MVIIESITMEEFRGVRNLTLNFAKKNFAICGPNGTGKSGVVDAAEFVLTGNISRLSGEGKGEVSVEQHAPHVDSRSNPGRAIVRATIVVPSLGNKQFVVERSAKTPKVYKITPNTPDGIKVIDFLTGHPEIVLSRRELIRYVLATPGKRADEVRALLQLESIDEVRLTLARIAKASTRTEVTVETDLKRSRQALMDAMDITAVTTAAIEPAVNERRAILALPPIENITAKTLLKDGVTTAVTKPQKIVKVQAAHDLKSLSAAMEATLHSEKWLERAGAIAAEISELAADPSAKKGVTVESFYSAGLKIIEEEACPFCDTEWDLKKLKAHIQQKLELLKQAAKKRAAIEKKVRALVEPLESVTYALGAVTAHGVNAKPAQLMPATRAFRQKLMTAAATAEKITPFADSLGALAEFKTIPAALAEELAELEKFIAALPDPSKEQAARDWLITAQERFDTYNKDRLRARKAKEDSERVKKIVEIYIKVSDGYLTSIFDAVQKQFAEYYRFLNSDDEGKFEARLVPSLGKLGFDVDFYGRGQFPAGAYHSEGHQDSMGLCLYLALMKHIHGDAFTIAVLDDVLMSVDAGHRREVCALLKKHFPKTQFVMTTHDPIWLNHMRTEKLIEGKNGMRFKTWDVAHGPTLLDDRDIWKEIEDHLKAANVREAAGALRHYVEYMAGEMCNSLKGQVEYRGDARYQLGELLPAAIRAMRKYLSAGAAAAKSWGNDALATEYSDRDKAFAALVTASNVEQWQINAKIHYNEWENLTPKEFAKVVVAFKVLLEGFQCSGCGGYLTALPEREAVEFVKCGCGKINISLGKKK